MSDGCDNLSGSRSGALYKDPCKVAGLPEVLKGGSAASRPGMAEVSRQERGASSPLAQGASTSSSSSSSCAVPQLARPRGASSVTAVFSPAQPQWIMTASRYGDPLFIVNRHIPGRQRVSGTHIYMSIHSINEW